MSVRSWTFSRWSSTIKMRPRFVPDRFIPAIPPRRRADAWRLAPLQAVQLVGDAQALRAGPLELVRVLVNLVIEGAAPRERRKVGRILPLQRIALALRPVDLPAEIALAPPYRRAGVFQLADFRLPEQLGLELARGFIAACLKLVYRAPNPLRMLSIFGLLLLIRRGVFGFLRDAPCGRQEERREAGHKMRSASHSLMIDHAIRPNRRARSSLCDGRGASCLRSGTAPCRATPACHPAGG